MSKSTKKPPIKSDKSKKLSKKQLVQNIIVWVIIFAMVGTMCVVAFS